MRRSRLIAAQGRSTNGGPRGSGALARKIAKYKLLAVPVFEQDGSVVGFVTVDNVIRSGSGRGVCGLITTLVDARGLVMSFPIAKAILHR